MKVSHYFEWERFITGGHAQSVRNQRTIMERRGVEYTTTPDLSADLLHLNNMGPRSVYHARRARKRGVPVVVHAHQTAEDFRESFALSNVLARPLRPYLEYAYSLADCLVCPSEYNRRTVETYADVETRVVSNGFDPEKVDDPGGLRGEYLDRWNLEPPVVFMVGHVIERKGLESFVETARRMPELDFVWFGFLNPMGGRIDRLLRSRRTQKLVDGAPDNCTFTGYVEDIRGAYAAGDVFFFPTKNENEGIALLEAMHSGSAILVRDIETFEWLTAGEDCLKGDGVAEFVEAIDELRDADRRDELGQRAREQSEEYSLDSVGDDLMDVYGSVV